jgi:ribosome biogenesis GTPase
MGDFSWIQLEDLGWNAVFAAEFERVAKPGWTPARLIRDNKISYGALFAGGIEREVVLSGRVYHAAENDADLPAVGDWVAMEVGKKEGEDSVIRERLQRQHFFSRKVPGDSVEEQILAANVDVVVVVTDAGGDFSVRRLERYLALISRGGARAVVLINKSDLYDEEELESASEAVRELGDDVEVHVISVRRRKGLKAVRELIGKGVTVAFVGSSGVGKSALVNRLLGEDWQETGDVNEVTGKGRHTTTARELLVLKKGGMIVDNPGIKEVQMWTDEVVLRERFVDVQRLADRCQYADCKHGEDAGCAIREAVIKGELETERYQGFLKLEDEIEELKKRQKKRQMTVERRNKREHRVKARNRVDRREIEADQKPRAADY